MAVTDIRLRVRVASSDSLRPRTTLGSAVAVECFVTDQDGAPVPGAVVDLSVVGLLVIPGMVADAAGRVTASFTPQQPGAFVAQADCTAPLAEVAQRRFDVVAAEGDPQLSPPWVDAGTGGLIFPPGDPVTAQRIDALPDGGLLLAGDSLPSVRDGAGVRVTGASVLAAAADAGAAAGLDAVEPEVAAAAQARSDAVAARDAAVTAALASAAAARAEVVAGVELMKFRQADTDAVDLTVFAKLGDALTAMDFGAKGDGSTDDQVAFGRAFTAMALRNGGTLDLMGRTYVLNGPAINLPSNVTIRNGWLRKTAADTVNNLFFNPISRTNIRIDGVVFERTGNGQVTGGVIFSGTADAFTTNVRVQNCTFIGCFGAAAERFCSKVWMERNAVLGGGRAFYGFAAGGNATASPGAGVCQDIYINHNYIENVRTEALDINWQVQRSTIIGNICLNCGAGSSGESIDIGGGSESLSYGYTVIGNIVIFDRPNNVIGGITIKVNPTLDLTQYSVVDSNIVVSLQGGGSAGITLSNALRVKVSNNIVRGCSNGILCTSSQREVEITGNHIYECTRRHISFAATQSDLAAIPRRCRIAGNFLGDESTATTFFEGSIYVTNCYDVEVVDNFIVLPATTGTLWVGIRAATGANFARISRNTVIGGSSAIVSTNANPGMVIRDNKLIRQQIRAIWTASGCDDCIVTDNFIRDWSCEGPTTYEALRIAGARPTVANNHMRDTESTRTKNVLFDVASSIRLGRNYWTNDGVSGVVPYNFGSSSVASVDLPPAEVATIATDESYTHLPWTMGHNVLHTGTLTVDRTIALPTSGTTQGVHNGQTLNFTRSGGGTGRLSIGGLRSLATGDWCQVKRIGSSWVVIAYGGVTTGIAVGLDPLDLPRNAELGSAAYWDAEALRGVWMAAQGAAYAITTTDYGRTLVAETGGVTWSLPLLADLPPGWWVRLRNRSTLNITVTRTGSDVIGASDTSLTIAPGGAAILAYRDGTRFEVISALGEAAPALLPGMAPLRVPRVADLGDAAFWPADGLRGQFPEARGAAYQIGPADFGRALVAETGTLTWTLPLLSDLVAGWWVRVVNRSGNTLTIARAGTDVIGAAATSITVADGASAMIAYRDTTRFERIA